MSRLRLTRRGELALSWAVALLVVISPGVAGVINHLLFGGIS